MRRVSVVVRAIITGLIVTLAASLPCGYLVQGNLKIATQIPWAAPVVLAYVFLYLKYLRGWGWPRSTAVSRRDSLRAAGLSWPAWRWSLLSGICAFAASIALLSVVRRLVAWPAAEAEFPPRLSGLFIVITLLVSAVVAGVSEEAGFRGYMQRMMERRYGPVFAILVTSIVFGLTHVTHGLRPLPLLFDGIWGGLYGILAYFSGSIVPGIILHSSLDFIEFLAAWKGVLGSRPLIWRSGLDLQLMIVSAAAIIFALAAVRAFRRLAAITRDERESKDIVG
jgi:membrane protease YdiL (CAAX protease family)